MPSDAEISALIVTVRDLEMSKRASASLFAEHATEAAYVADTARELHTHAEMLHQAGIYLTRLLTISRLADAQGTGAIARRQLRAIIAGGDA